MRPFLVAVSHWDAYANQAANRARILPEVHVIGGQCNRAKLETKSQTLALTLYHRVAKGDADVAIKAVIACKGQFRLRIYLAKACGRERANGQLVFEQLVLCAQHHGGA